MAEPIPAASASSGPWQQIVPFAGRALRRQWRTMILPLGLGAILSLAVAFAFGKQSWESTGVMLYTPVPIPESQKGLSPQPDLQTLVSLLKSPAILDGVREEFGLTVPNAVLEKMIAVTAPRTVQTVTVSIRWADSTTAAQLINRLMERYIDQVRDRRRHKAAEHLADYEARLSECDARFARVSETYQRFFQSRDILDAKSSIDSLRRDLDSARQTRTTAARSEVIVKAQREKMLKEMASIQKKEDDQAAKAREFDASLETVSENRRRQDRLRELIEEEKRRETLMVELSVKRKELQRLVPLRDRGAVAPADVETLEGEIRRLTALLNDNEQVKKWKEELTKIDQVVVPAGKSPSSGSPIIQQTLAKILDLDLQLTGIQQELRELDDNIDTDMQRLTSLQLLFNRSEGIQKELDGVAAERHQLAEQVGVFRRLRDQTAGEFTVVSPAKPEPYPASSSRKLFLFGGLALSAFLALGRAVRREVNDSYHAGRQLTARYNIPVLAEWTADPTSQRSAATEFRQWLPNYGSVLLFTSDGEIPVAERVAVQLVERLARRDERVLILDCRLAPERDSQAMTGISDYLQFREVEWEPLLAMGTEFGVEWLPPGCGGDPDELASHRMRELVETARTKYSTVILLGPPLSDPQTLLLLAALASGVLVTLTEARPSEAIRSGLSFLHPRIPSRLRSILVTRSNSATDPLSGQTMLC